VIQRRTIRSGCPAILIMVTVVATIANAAEKPLPSWHDGATRQSILNFVASVTEPGSPAFVPPARRIATFDNDGTLWAEQPMYTQLLFALDRVHALAPTHPEWRHEEPFASILAGETGAALAGGEAAILDLIMATHAGLSTEQFEDVVLDWLDHTVHPSTGRPYTEMVYQPMLELLEYLRTKGFKTYIVSGGGIEFMRPWTQAVYGIPPEQVIGSSIKTKYVVQDGTPMLERLPEVNFIDDKAGKPVGIHTHIGRRPLAAFGNSDGDFEMLEWTTGGDGPALAALVHHTDAEREWAYDRESSIGRLDLGLDEAEGRGWLVIDMKRDWRVVFPPAAANAESNPQ
jgi:hypothetical protein